MLLLAALLACTAPSPGPPTSPEREAAPARAPETPPADVLAAWLADLGLTAERHGGVLRAPLPGGPGAVALHVQPMPEAEVVYLATSELLTLRDAAGERGIVLLLTTMAASNYEVLEGKLQLNPATGAVLLSLELPTDDGLGRETFQDAVRTLGRVAAEVTPALRQAATGASL